MNKQRMLKAIQHGSSGLDVIHGQLKDMMLQAEDDNFAIGKMKDWKRALGHEISSRRAWLEGYREALANVYRLTYEVSFLERDVETERSEDNGNTMPK